VSIPPNHGVYFSKSAPRGIALTWVRICNAGDGYIHHLVIGRPEEIRRSGATRSVRRDVRKLRPQEVDVEPNQRESLHLERQ
jgi:hypothetical protein